MPDDLSIFNAISIAGESLLVAELDEYREWIHNSSCSLCGLIEIGGCLVPLPLLKERAARDGMSIITDSPGIKEEMERRVRLLKDQNECYFIHEWQKMIAIEGENSGFITFKNWENFQFPIREMSPAIVHDPNKCIRCKSCVDTCRDIQGVEALKFDDKLGVVIDEERCTLCGQCIHKCPMGAVNKSEAVINFLHCRNCAFAEPLGAMHEVDDSIKAWALLHNPDIYCVAEFAPAIRASIGEKFGIEAGELVTGKLYAALRRLGFNKVWDTNFAADLTIMEEGMEFIERFTKQGKLPLFTSCCPSWLRFAVCFFPDLLHHISTTKSPQQMFGAIAKTYGAENIDVNPAKMRVISFMPCTAKKAEAARVEMNNASVYWQNKNGQPGSPAFQDVDLVLTARELIRLLKMAGIDLEDMPDEGADPLLGRYTGAAPIFGRTGGVMEAALRTAVALLCGEPPVKLEFEELGTCHGIKSLELNINDMPVKVAVVHGLANARTVCESVRAGGEFAGYHFIEFMACPGGCVGGGGQPIPTNTSTRMARIAGLNRDDQQFCEIRMSHENPEIKALYADFLEKPLSHLSHQLLHTTGYRGGG